MTPQVESKLERVKEILRQAGSCAVAYSGGVDSSLLLAIAREVLGDRCMALTAAFPFHARRETEAALQWVKHRDIPVGIVRSDELDIPRFRENPPDRCYHCKKAMFERLMKTAASRGFDRVVDGTNADDMEDYRPGIRALRELGVSSPLNEAGLTKADIRTIARERYALPMAGKPTSTCLATRIPFGSPITVEKLKQVEAVEDFLADMGFLVCRARHHDEILRLELPPSEIPAMLQPEARSAIVDFAKKTGFSYVALDMQGYRGGSAGKTTVKPSADESR